MDNWIDEFLVRDFMVRYVVRIWPKQIKEKIKEHRVDPSANISKRARGADYKRRSVTIIIGADKKKWISGPSPKPTLGSLGTQINLKSWE